MQALSRFAAQYLSDLVNVPFRVKHKEEVIDIGNGNPEFTISIKNNIDKKALLMSTSLALGEAYMRGDISIDIDLYDALDILLKNIKNFKTDKSALKRLIYTSLSKKNQQKEVSSHYDIGNDFYSLWLDETMSYSCAYFKNDSDSLYQAQVNKVHHVIDKLNLEEGMTLLDVGCGWGFLLKEAARLKNIKGMGITLSKEQYAKFKNDIEKEGLGGSLSVELMDYRDLKCSGRKFDRVVSIGMLEHVGRGNYEEFISSIDGVLESGGLFMLHYISSLYENPGDAWIKKYIFPGGVIPSLREIVNIFPEHNFHTLDIEDLRPHYNKTLLCWRNNFLNNAKKIQETKGMDFFRMWDIYLAACAAAFHNAVVDVHQVLTVKGVNNRLPLIRAA